MHYVVIIPDVTGASNEHLKAVGLDSLGLNADWFDITKQSIPGHPDVSGMAAIWSNPDNPESVPPLDPREWRNWHLHIAEPDPDNDLEAGRFLIGWDPENPPGPDDLKRRKPYAGHGCRMGDGQDWLIPSYMRLEHVYRYRSGKMVREPEPQWQEFCKRCEEITRNTFSMVGLADLLDGKPLELDDPDTEIKTTTVEHGAEHVALALSINYRLNVEIASALGLLVDSVLPQAISCSIDLPEIIAVYDEKKSLDSVEIPVTSST